MIIDPDSNSIVHGSRFELSAQDVIDYCEGAEATGAARTRWRFHVSESKARG